MTKDIAAKLRKHLAGAVDTECAVVYLLAEVRKILERDERGPKPFALWMYCHWALHVDLSRSKTTLEFLRRVEDYVVKTVPGFTPDTPNPMFDSVSFFRDLVYLDTFRGQLRQFLTDHDLPTKFCGEDEAWISFLTAYAGIVEDGSISSETAKNDGLHAIEKVVFRKGGWPIAADGLFKFVVTWDILLKDGRIVMVGFEPKANGEVLLWGPEIIQAPTAQAPVKE